MKDKSFLSHFPSEATKLLKVQGVDLVERLGMDALRDVVCEVLAGVNIRNATESLTRKRIGLLNASLFIMFVRAQQNFGPLQDDVALIAYNELKKKNISQENKKVLWWILGLTKKQIDNVLRADESSWKIYLTDFSEATKETAKEAERLYGELSASISLTSNQKESIHTNWRWAIYLMTAIGSQTLATRGSEKSMYGKFFEKLILAGVLHVLGLKLVNKDSPETDNVFWLSSRGDKRESDATALFGLGKGVRFDIGFIGVGNTEISLDKVSRFERQMEHEGKKYDIKTFIIVDRIGKGSRIVDLAQKIDGTILQMSASYWPVQLADELQKEFKDFQSPFHGKNEQQRSEYIRKKIDTAPFEEIFEFINSSGIENDL